MGIIVVRPIVVYYPTSPFHILIKPGVRVWRQYIELREIDSHRVDEIGRCLENAFIIFIEAKDKSHVDCLFLANHGVVCSGPSVAQAFDDLYYLERAARQQVLAQSTGQELLMIPEETVELTAQQFRNDFKVYAGKHFEALKRLVAL